MATTGYPITPRRNLIAPTAPRPPTVPGSWSIQPAPYKTPYMGQTAQSTGGLAQASPVGVTAQRASASTAQEARFPTASTSRLTPSTPAARDVFNTAFGPQNYPVAQMFEPRANIPWPGDTGVPTGDNPLQKAMSATQIPKDQQRMLEQLQLLGPLAEILMSPGQVLRRGDIPMLEAGLNYQQLLKAEEDRQRGYEELARAWGSVGQDPTSMAYKEMVRRMMGQGGPYSPDVLAQLEGKLTGESALSQEAMSRQMAEEYARRGLGGGAMPYEMASLQQTGARDLGSQLADLRNQAVLANEAAQQQWTQMFGAQAAQEEQYRQALNELLANVFLQTERAPIDLGSLATGVPSARKAV